MKNIISILIFFLSFNAVAEKMSDKEIIETIRKNPNVSELEISHNSGEIVLVEILKLKNLKSLTIQGSAKVLKEMNGSPSYVDFSDNGTEGKRFEFITVNENTIYIFEPLKNKLLVETILKLNSLKELKIWYGRLSTKDKFTLKLQKPHCKLAENINKL